MLGTKHLDEIYSHLIPKDRFLIGYVGSVGLANALEYFVEAANILHDDDVFFLIVGEGEKLSELKKFVRQRNMKNIMFLPKIKKNQVPSLIPNSLGKINFQSTNS